MPTTLRIDDDLKRRVAALAKVRGVTPHAFMVDVMQTTVTELEEDEAFYRLAEEREREFLRTGEVIELDEFTRYMKETAAGKSPAPPEVRKMDVRTGEWLK